MGFVSVHNGAARSQQVTLAAPGVRIPLTAQQEASLPAGTKEVTVGIRPEHLQVRGDGAGAGDATVEGVVEVVEPLGSEQHVLVRVSGDLVTAKLPREHRFRRDERVRFSVPADRLYLFDPESGLAYR
jgi:ABC-type sugar transport system ATPase subunit